MVKRILSVLLAVMLVLGLFAGCGNDGVLSEDDAKKVVLEDLNLQASSGTQMDVHMTTVDGLACYAVYITVGDVNWEYVISSLTGEILQRNEKDSGHSH